MRRKDENQKLHKILDDLGFCDGSINNEEREIIIIDEDGTVTWTVVIEGGAIEPYFYETAVMVYPIYEDAIQADEGMHLGEFILRFFE